MSVGVRVTVNMTIKNKSDTEKWVSLLQSLYRLSRKSSAMEKLVLSAAGSSVFVV